MKRVITCTSANIHEQVRLQLEYLKSLVDAEAQRKQNCAEWGIKYVESNTAQTDKYNYRMYQKAIDSGRGDKLLVLVKEKSGEIRPYARRYACGTDYEYSLLIHRPTRNTEWLVNEDDVDVVRK